VAKVMLAQNQVMFELTQNMLCTTSKIRHPNLT